MGDGDYDFWIGYDDSGDIAMLVVDLELLDPAQPREDHRPMSGGALISARRTHRGYLFP